jgi:hypothetical protein
MILDMVDIKISNPLFMKLFENTKQPEKLEYYGSTQSSIGYYMFYFGEIYL